MKNLIRIIIFVVFSSFAYAQNSSEIKKDSIVDDFFTVEKLKSVFTPRTIQWQYAGNIGMHSIGADWNIYRKKFNVGFSIGYVPDSRSIDPLFIGTLHLNYNSLVKIKLNERFHLEPLNFSFMVSTTYGERFAIYGDTDYYPDNYYWWGVRTRLGVAHTMDLHYKLNDTFLDGIGLYFNSSIWDIEFYNTVGNDNLELDNIPFARLFTFGIGLRLYLK